MSNPESQYNSGERFSRNAAAMRAITPDDTNEVERVFGRLPRGLRIGNVSVGAEITLIEPTGETILKENCFNGERIDASFTHVKATGTTVTNIVAYY